MKAVACRSSSLHLMYISAAAEIIDDAFDQPLGSPHSVHSYPLDTSVHVPDLISFG